ncbi:MAG: endonuclease/exonuclease/phosphatase family protein [Pseudomonadota bacterium]
MSEFSIASFNVKNLIGPEQEYYRFESYTLEEHAWKQDWLSDQLLTLDADIVGFQEIFEESALQDVIGEADRKGKLANEDVIPDPSKRYARKAIFRKLAYRGYRDAGLVFAPNVTDGAPGQRRPGLAILSRHGFAEPPEIIQDFPSPIELPFSLLGGGDGGGFILDRISRPILKARISIGSHTVTVFNCHLKSKLGEFIRDPDGRAAENDLLSYDPVGRAAGSLRAAVRRMAEAWALRGLIVAELEAGYPVIVLGDFNDGEHAVSSEIISGEVPFKNYAWIRRHDARRNNDRYSDAENDRIQEAMDRVRLTSCEALFVQKSLRDMVYTTSFGGVFESIDQIFLSRHFTHGPQQIGEMDYYSVLNDHLADGSHPEAPYNKLASDHGQIMAHLRFWEE